MSVIEIPKCPYITLPPSPDDYGLIVTITAGSGEAQRTFYAYEGLLSHYSSYFRAELEKKWEEGATKTVMLPENNPEVFRAFFHWLMTGNLYFSLTPEEKIPLEMQIICEIYVFGYTYGIPQLCNSSIDLLFQEMTQEWCPCDYQLDYIYKNTLPGSPLRRFVVNDAVACWSLNSLLENPHLYPKEFLIDLIVQSKKLRCTPGGRMDDTTWVNLSKSQLCTYHDHSDYDKAESLSMT